MNYTEFLENNMDVFMEIYSLYKSKKTIVSKNKIDKSRLKISATRLNLTRGKEKHSKKQKSEEQIRALATKSARRILAKKLMAKNYDSLNDSERIEYAKRKKNHKELYARIVDEEFKKLKSKYSGLSKSKDVVDKTKGR